MTEVRRSKVGWRTVHLLCLFVIYCLGERGGRAWSSTLCLSLSLSSLDYIVEKCEEGTNFWEKVPGASNATSCPVKRLEEGKNYKFRVRAVNKSGTGPPLETPKSIKAKNPYGE